MENKKKLQNAASYSTLSASLAGALIVIITYNQQFNAEYIAALQTVVTILLNVILVAGKVIYDILVKKLKKL